MKRASPKSPSKLSNYRLFRLIGLDSINSGHRNEDTTSQRMSESSTSEDEWSSVCDSDSDLMAIDDVGTRHQKIKTFLQADEACSKAKLSGRTAMNLRKFMGNFYNKNFYLNSNLLNKHHVHQLLGGCIEGNNNENVNCNCCLLTIIDIIMNEIQSNFPNDNHRLNIFLIMAELLRQNDKYIQHNNSNNNQINNINNNKAVVRRTNDNSSNNNSLHQYNKRCKIPRNWPTDIEFTSTLLWRQIPVATQERTFQREAYSHVQIQKITNPRHPCSNQFGLFATQNIPINRLIGFYTGVVKEDKGVVNLSKYLIRLFDDDGIVLDIDAEHAGNETRFINDFRNTGHQPNVDFHVEFEPLLGVLTCRVTSCRQIKKGDEILTDYGDEYWSAIHANQPLYQQPQQNTRKPAIKRQPQLQSPQQRPQTTQKRTQPARKSMHDYKMDKEASQESDTDFFNDEAGSDEQQEYEYEADAVEDSDSEHEQNDVLPANMSDSEESNSDREIQRHEKKRVIIHVARKRNI